MCIVWGSTLRGNFEIKNRWTLYVVETNSFNINRMCFQFVVSRSFPRLYIIASMHFYEQKISLLKPHTHESLSPQIIDICRFVRIH